MTSLRPGGKEKGDLISISENEERRKMQRTSSLALDHQLVNLGEDCVVVGTDRVGLDCREGRVNIGSSGRGAGKVTHDR